MALPGIDPVRKVSIIPRGIGALGYTIHGAGQINGDRAAKAIQLAIEYDPQPPYDAGHLSKASAVTKTAALTMLAKEFVRAGQLTTPIQLLWSRSLAKVRDRRQKAVVQE